MNQNLDCTASGDSLGIGGIDPRESFPAARPSSPAAVRLLRVGALLAVLLGSRPALSEEVPEPSPPRADSGAATVVAPSDPARFRIQEREFRLSRLSVENDSLRKKLAEVSPPVAAHTSANFATRLRDSLYQILGQSTVDLLVVLGSVLAAAGLLRRHATNWFKMHDEDECSANVTFLAGNVMTTRGYFGVSNIREIWPNAIEQQMIRHAEQQANQNKEWPFAGFRPDERGRKIFRKLRSVISREVESFKLWEVKTYSEGRLAALKVRYPSAGSRQDQQAEEDAPNQAFLALSYEVNKEGHMRVNTILGADLIDMLTDLEKWYRHTPLGKFGDRAFCGDTQRLVTNLEMAVSIVLQQPQLVRPLVAAHPEIWAKVEQTAHNLRRLLVLDVDQSCKFLWGYVESPSKVRVELNERELERLHELWSYKPGFLDRAISFLRHEPIPSGVPHWFTVMDLWNPELVLPRVKAHQSRDSELASL
ncbi:MAG: hypothetical protein K1X83_08050 [Oligoflexia bacterium]|nr:hypothetical protein [Oligoflexia bacterium]